MRTFSIVISSVVVFSCGLKSTKQAREMQHDFQSLVSNIKVLGNGFNYDVVREDAEGCFIPDEKIHSSFYDPSFPILGQMNNGTIYSLIHFEPGSDMWPVVRTFTKDGKLIDNAPIAFGYCAGAACEAAECDEKFSIIDQNTIEVMATRVTTSCDSLKVIDPKLVRQETWKKTITVDYNGKLSTKVERQ